MKKSQVVIIVIGVVLVIGLYTLPRVVVDNENDNSGAFLDEEVPSGVVDHSSSIPEEIQPVIANLKAELFVNDKLQEGEEVLDSLMIVFASINQYDSAAYYAEEYALAFESTEYWQKAGDAYFEAFSFALDEQKVNFLGEKSREAYDKVLSVDPDNLDVMHNVALTYVSSAAPMRGIMMLREIIAKDPANEKALMSMGRMSIQTGQFANGIERFETLVDNYPSHVEGNFFLGVCYFENGDLVKAKAQFNKVKTLNASEQVLTAADEYLERIK